MFFPCACTGRLLQDGVRADDMGAVLGMSAPLAVGGAVQSSSRGPAVPCQATNGRVVVVIAGVISARACGIRRVAAPVEPVQVAARIERKRKQLPLTWTYGKTQGGCL